MKYILMADIFTIYLYMDIFVGFCKINADISPKELLSIFVIRIGIVNWPHLFSVYCIYKYKYTKHFISINTKFIVK